MKLFDVALNVDATILTPKLNLSRQVYWAYGADLLSDVLAYTWPETLLLTGLINTQVIRTAELADLGGIVVVRGKYVNQTLIELANKCNIPIMQTTMTMFESCGRLFGAGLSPCARVTGGDIDVRSAL